VKTLPWTFNTGAGTGTPDSFSAIGCGTSRRVSPPGRRWSTREDDEQEIRGRVDERPARAPQNAVGNRAHRRPDHRRGVSSWSTGFRDCQQAGGQRRKGLLTGHVSGSPPFELRKNRAVPPLTDDDEDGEAGRRGVCTHCRPPESGVGCLPPEARGIQGRSGRVPRPVDRRLESSGPGICDFPRDVTAALAGGICRLPS